LETSFPLKIAPAQRQEGKRSEPMTNVGKVVKALGAKVIARIPRTGGDAFAAARLAGIVARLQASQRLGGGKRPGRNTDSKRAP
jgi:hypothetical protein